MASPPVEGLADVDEVEALFAYDDRIRKIVLAAKNGGRSDLWRQLGILLAHRLGEMGDGETARSAGPSNMISTVEAVTWVPASNVGRRRRGFDQGRLLARSVAKELGIPARRLLVRRGGRSQTGQLRADRLRGPDLWAPIGAPRRVLVIDDVITTGTSLSAAAATLRSGGAEFVAAAAIARADRSALAPGLLRREDDRRAVL